MALAPRQTRFLIVFAVLLIAFYALITIGWVDTHAVLPFTGALARISGAALNVIGERVHVDGTIIAGPKLAVDIRGGCNGLEAVVFVCAAMVAFHAPVRQRLIGAPAAAATPQPPQLSPLHPPYLLRVAARS